MRDRIELPPTDVRELSQDEVYFFVLHDGEKERIRLRDYGRIYSTPGLFEQVV